MIVALIIVAVGFAFFFAGCALLYRNAPIEPPYDFEDEPYLDHLEAYDRKVQEQRDDLRRRSEW